MDKSVKHRIFCTCSVAPPSLTATTSKQVQDKTTKHHWHHTFNEVELSPHSSHDTRLSWENGSLTFEVFSASEAFKNFLTCTSKKATIYVLVLQRAKLWFERGLSVFTSSSRCHRQQPQQAGDCPTSRKQQVRTPQSEREQDAEPLPALCKDTSLLEKTRGEIFHLKDRKLKFKGQLVHTCWTGINTPVYIRKG